MQRVWMQRVWLRIVLSCFLMGFLSVFLNSVVVFLYSTELRGLQYFILFVILYNILNLLKHSVVSTMLYDNQYGYTIRRKLLYVNEVIYYIISLY